MSSLLQNNLNAWCHRYSSTKHVAQTEYCIIYLLLSPITLAHVFSKNVVYRNYNLHRFCIPTLIFYSQNNKLQVSEVLKRDSGKADVVYKFYISTGNIDFLYGLLVIIKLMEICISYILYFTYLYTIRKKNILKLSGKVC